MTDQQDVLQPDDRHAFRMSLLESVREGWMAAELDGVPFGFVETMLALSDDDFERLTFRSTHEGTAFVEAMG